MQFHNLKVKDGNVTEYISKLSKITTTIHSIGQASLTDANVISKILSNLACDPEWQSIVTTYRTMKMAGTNIKLKELMNLIISTQEQVDLTRKRQSKTQASSNDVALMAKPKMNKNIQCFQCKKFGHKKNE